MEAGPIIPITRQALAKRLEVCLTRLDTMVKKGQIPAPKCLGDRRLYWHPEVIDRWLNERLLEGPPPAGASPLMPLPAGALPAASASGTTPPSPVVLPPPQHTALSGLAKKAKKRDEERLAKLNA